MNQMDELQSFLVERNGRIVCISDDFTIFRSLRYSISGLVESVDDYLMFHENVEAASSTIDAIYREGNPLVVFIERVVKGEKTTDIVFRINRLCPDACLLVVGTGITKDVVSYLFELGVSGIISKPVSADDILKKLLACAQVSKEQALTSYVRELIASSNQTEALEAVEKYLAINPESSIAYCLKGDIVMASGELDKAVEAYNQSSRLNLYYSEPLKRMAAIHKYVNDDKALQLLQKVDSLNPFNPDRKLEMAEIHLRRGEEDEAQKLFDEGYRQASKEFSLLLGDYAERISNLASALPDIAEEYLAKVVETKKVFTLLDIHIFNKLGMMHRNKGEWREAIDVYKKALEISPADPVLYYNMALAYHDGAKQGDVSRCLSKSLELGPRFYEGNEGVSYNIGSIYLEYGDKSAAKGFFEHVLELNPDNEKATVKLARCDEE